MTMTNEGKKSSDEVISEPLLTEYAATQNACFHYDNFSWQVGAVLIAGVFVFWGFVISSEPDKAPWFVANFLVWAIMTIWFLYVEHNRQMYLYKLHRIKEIEEACGMYQHRRFQDNKTYVRNKPSGYCLDGAIYAVISLGGPTLAWVSSGKWQSMILVLLVAIVIWRTDKVDRCTKAVITELEKQAANNMV